jgi:phosphotransferase system enzyme I (PtsI)
VATENNWVDGLFRGIPVSEGIGIGKVWILESPWDEIPSYILEENQIEDELERYDQAIHEVNEQLEDCQLRVLREIGDEEAKIFQAHLSILKDPFFLEEIPKSIKNLQRNVEFALKLRII